MRDPRKILVIQLKRAGDVIVTTPVLQALRQALPHAAIDFLVDQPFASLLENNPNVDHVQVYDRRAVWETWKRLRAASYDWILDFQSSPRSILAGLYSGASFRAGYAVTFWGLFFHNRLKRPGGNISVTEGKMNLVRTLLPSLPAAAQRKIYLSDSERQWAKEQMKGMGSDVVGIIPTHRRQTRRWPAASFAALARSLVLKGRAVYFFWGPGEKEYVSDIARQVPESRMIPDASLRQMAALLDQCKIIVTNDNGPMHLAVAVGAPTVTIYGPTDPLSWNPGGPRHQVVQAAHLSCLGCNMNVCPFGHECMNWILPQEVLARCQ